MLTTEQQQFLESAARAAKAAGHIWPGMAACEAADESAWGTSDLARKDFNLFGQKQQNHPVYGTVEIPTREFLNHRWVVENAEWVVFPTLEACFSSRMDTLRRLMTTYPHYGMALAAAMPEVYVTEVSLSWSTNPKRATDCIAIYHAHLDILNQAVNA